MELLAPQGHKLPRMGFMDDVRKINDDKAANAAAATAALEGCAGDHYVTEVNKGSINMRTWQAHLNDMHRRGYRLAHVFEQDGNTVQVFEHHIH
jgi:hypothetical protein